MPPRSPLFRASRALSLASIGALVLGAHAGCILFGNDLTRAPAPTSSGSAAVTPAPPPLQSGRLPATAKPLRYALALTIDPTQERFTGDVTITVDVPAETRAIVMHGRDLVLSRAEATAGGRQVPADASVRMAAGNRDAADELVLAFAEPLPAGRAELRIAYSAPIGDRLSGLFRVKEEGATYAFTQLEPTDARRVFPCFDEPGYKSSFELKVTAPKGNVVVANAPERDHLETDEGRSVTYRFAPTPPLPTYLFALAVGPLDAREGPKGAVPLRLVAPRGKAKLGELALEAASGYTRLLTDYFDRPFPYPKLDLLAVPEFGFGAMENAGLISFREELVLLDPKDVSADARRAMDSALAHEIAHHWFGNLVTMSWWDDLWLNEGFATWIESKMIDQHRPNGSARIDAVRAKTAVMELDSLDSARAVRQRIAGSGEAEDAFEGTTYDKGAAVLGMLEAWLGADAFRAGVRAYLKDHENGSATAADLFAALSKASGKDVAPVASSFLDQAGVPLVRAELACRAGEPPEVALAQEWYRTGSRSRSHERAWKIPACVAFEGAGKSGPACGFLGEATTTIRLPLPAGQCPRWIYPNAEERGYYRFALPPAQRASLLKAGNALAPAERLGAIAGAWALVLSGDLGADELFDLLEATRRDRHRLVIEQLVDTLRRVSGTLVDPSARPAFRAFASKILQGIARDLGWDPRKGEPDERRLLRAHVLSALADLTDDAWVAAESEKRAAAWLKKPGSVDMDVTAVALAAASRRAGEKRFTELTEAAKRARSPEERVAAVSALGGFGDPALLRRALDLVITQPIKIQDGFYIVNTALARPEARPVVLAWVKERFAELKGKVPDFALGRLASVVETICDAPTLEDAASFFGEALRGTEGGERALVHALERSELCIEVRAREAARVKKRLGAK
jgi:aminopeptidase N